MAIVTVTKMPKTGIPVATLSDAQHYNVRARPSGPGVSILCRGEKAGLNCNYLPPVWQHVIIL